MERKQVGDNTIVSLVTGNSEGLKIIGLQFFKKKRNILNKRTKHLFPPVTYTDTKFSEKLSLFIRLAKKVNSWISLRYSLAGVMSTLLRCRVQRYLI